jgi:hypothetical protein
MRAREKSVTVNVVGDEEHPVGRLLEEELPEQRHGAALINEPHPNPGTESARTNSK